MRLQKRADGLLTEMTDKLNTLPLHTESGVLDIPISPIVFSYGLPEGYVDDQAPRPSHDEKGKEHKARRRKSFSTPGERRVPTQEEGARVTRAMAVEIAKIEEEREKKESRKRKRGGGVVILEEVGGDGEGLQSPRVVEKDVKPTRLTPAERARVRREREEEERREREVEEARREEERRAAEEKEKEKEDAGGESVRRSARKKGGDVGVETPAVEGETPAVSETPATRASRRKRGEEPPATLPVQTPKEPEPEVPLTRSSRRKTFDNKPFSAPPTPSQPIATPSARPRRGAAAAAPAVTEQPKPSTSTSKPERKHKGWVYLDDNEEVGEKSLLGGKPEVDLEESIMTRGRRKSVLEEKTSGSGTPSRSGRGGRRSEPIVPAGTPVVTVSGRALRSAKRGREENEVGTPGPSSGKRFKTPNRRVPVSKETEDEESEDEEPLNSAKRRKSSTKSDQSTELFRFPPPPMGTFDPPKRVGRAGRPLPPAINTSFRGEAGQETITAGGAMSGDTTITLSPPKSAGGRRRGSRISLASVEGDGEKAAGGVKGFSSEVPEFEGRDLDECEDMI
ncbi:hypothetical protein HK097_005910, partial [Rhizophlyctis rosea]